MLSKATLISLLLASSVTALDVPANVRKFYNDLKAKGTCTNKLATGFYDSKFDDGSKSLTSKLTPENLNFNVSRNLLLR